MTVQPHANAQTIGKRFAEIVRERALPVTDIRVQDTGEGPRLWVVIEPMELKDELPVHRAFVELQRCFPDSMFDDRVINPAWLGSNLPDQEIPPDAVRISLRS